jgi:2-polyprenyl-6-methoxyphenol hydroxylase-like FAD-dependent oxidoreductase
MAMRTVISSRHDVVVVGARCGGGATAMLLARLGHDVVVVDQASLPERHDLDAFDRA